MKMSEMNEEQLREFALKKIETNKELAAANQGLRDRVAELESALAALPATPAELPDDAARDPRVVWADGLVSDMIAEIHTINQTSDNSLIGLNGAEVDLKNKIIAIRNECPRPGLVKGIANKFLVEPLEAECARVQASIERETLKVINS